MATLTQQASGQVSTQDDTDTCPRGTGGYIAILDQIIRFSPPCPAHLAASCLQRRDSPTVPRWRGEWQTARELVPPVLSDLATVVSHCIMGYPLGSRSKCQGDISKARNILEANEVQELVHDVLDKIHAKSYKDYFIVYWTSYPQFFEVADTTNCDTSYFQEGIWAGEYLKTALLNQLNELSTLVNDLIDVAIGQYHPGLLYPKAAHVNIEKLGNIYQGKRFSEPGVRETLKSEAEQATVAFFCDNGGDDIPQESEGFHLRPQRPNAPSGWSIDNYNSGTCSAAEPGDSSEPPGCYELRYGQGHCIRGGLYWPGGVTTLCTMMMCGAQWRWQRHDYRLRGAVYEHVPPEDSRALAYSTSCQCRLPKSNK